MPCAVFKSVREVSSEDDVHVAANLLQMQAGKKWKTKFSGESTAYVILELQEELHITGIDIGNEHSAFVEVLVAKAASPKDDFVEILTTSSFMTPIESKNSTNTNRVRCFGKDALIDNIYTKKWHMVKVVCSQPFNKFVQFGLSFIKIHTTEYGKKKDQALDVISTKFIHSKTSKNVNVADEVRNETSLRLGNFALLKDSSDSESESFAGMFSRWKSARTRNTEVTPLTETACSPTTSENVVKPKMNIPGDHLEILRKQGDYSGALLENYGVSSIGRLENKVQIDEEPRHSETGKLKMKTKNSKGKSIMTETFNPSEVELSEVEKIKDPIADKPIIPSYIDKAQKRTPSLSNRPAKKMKLQDIVKFTPFNKLLKGVVIVISGIQNPDRADLRSKALEMGARYKSKWDYSCTHLICNFKNTPKFNEVVGKGKIVTSSWIKKCYTMKRYLPWRRFALDTEELNKSESDEEVLDESLNPAAFRIDDKAVSYPVIKKAMDTNKNQNLVKCDIRKTEESQYVGPEDGIPLGSFVTIDSKNHKDRNKIYEALTDEEDFLCDKKKQSL